MKFTEVSTDLNGSKLTFQVGKLAKASHVSILGRLGDTSVLVTVNVGPAREDIDYMPLSVEYVEKLYAGGRIKGSRWVKREGKPSDEAVLNARIIDRSIRPLFPKSYRKNIQVVITLLSIDGVNSPEILGALTAFAALHISALPWNGPIAISRVAYLPSEGEGSLVVHPKEAEQKFSAMDLVVASTPTKVLMIETEAEQLSEEIILEGIKKAQEANKELITFIEDFRKKVGLEKEVFTETGPDEKLVNVLKKDFAKEIDAFIAQKAEKEFEDKEALDALVNEIAEKHKDEFDKKSIAKTIDVVSKEKLKEMVLKTKKRIDGRGADDIREIGVEVSVLPRIHGSAVFNRGDTQVLSIVTLGSPSMEQLIESPEGEEAKRYIHHYFMPPYSLGEVGRIGFPSRREIGHGALAEKAVEMVLPDAKDFPYTIRVVSEVLSSNGSTSQASVCGSILALMDAGVPIKAPVAGIAMGLYGNPDKDYMLMTDIMGIEDFTGEMDFKVAGSENGITAVQLDVKNDGLSEKFIAETLEKAKKARLFILGKMNAVLAKSRTDVSEFAPKVAVLTPPQEKIGEIIGPGGRNIKALIAQTGTEINISADGKVTISGVDKAKVEEAKSLIENMVREVEEGEEFDGEVMRLLPFGAFVEILPGKEGMIHVSKMGKGFVKDPGDVVKVGQKVKVKVIQIDNQNRINLQLLS